MTKEIIIKNAEKVNDYWIKETPGPGNAEWERACYMNGAIDAYRITGRKDYLDRVVKWAEANEWRFARDPEYNNTCADDILCGDTYLDLIDEFGIDGTTEHMDKTLEWTANDPANDYWWWIDTFHMALNFYNRIGVRNKDDRFFDKAYNLYMDSKVTRTCFDEEEDLWFRDERFLFDKEQNAEGKKIFWSRGNGWVFAGIAKTLRTLPKDNKYYKEYLDMFLRMAKRIKALQLSDGFWHTDLLSPTIFDMPETSGTVLFALGMMIGVNEGLLGKEYAECAIKAYEAINREAIDEDGRIGWVQVVAWDPGPVKREATNDYAVGTYLKVSYELLKMLG